MPWTVAALSTVPSRREACWQVVESLAPQVEELWVFFDQLTPVDRALAIAELFDRVRALNPKCVAHSWDPGDFMLGDAAKFEPVKRTAAPDDALYLSCDDDLRYPEDYATTMRAAFDRHGWAHPAQPPPLVVAAHGGRLRGTVRTWRDAINSSYRVAQALGATLDGERFNVPGTGCMATKLGLLRGRTPYGVDALRLPIPSTVADLHVAVWMQRHRIAGKAVGHAKGWLEYLLAKDEPTLWSAGKDEAGELRRTEEDAIVRRVRAWRVY